MVDDEVDEGGNRHATDGREHGQGGLTGTAQLADGELVLELDAHEQEEDRHEEVVHEGLDGDRDHERPDAEREGRLEELMDGTVGIGVRHGDGDEGREYHDRRGDRPVGGDLLEGGSRLDPPDDCGVTIDACHVCPFVSGVRRKGSVRSHLRCATDKKSLTVYHPPLDGHQV